MSIAYQESYPILDANVKRVISRYKKIDLNGNEARVHGGQTLTGARVVATDLRASASMVMAGLVASGQTVIDQVYHLDRGYDFFVGKLARLGAHIERVPVIESEHEQA